MHLVVFRIVRLHRQKCAGADMQRHEMPFDAPAIQRRKKLGRKVQPCGRGRNRTFLARIDSLVVGQITLVVFPFGRDVRRQRYVPDRMQRFVQKNARYIKGQQRFASIAFLNHRGVQCAKQARRFVVTETDTIALGNPLGGA